MPRYFFNVRSDTTLDVDSTGLDLLWMKPSRTPSEHGMSRWLMRHWSQTC